MKNITYKTWTLPLFISPFQQELFHEINQTKNTLYNTLGGLFLAFGYLKKNNQISVKSLEDHYNQILFFGANDSPLNDFLKKTLNRKNIPKEVKHYFHMLPLSKKTFKIMLEVLKKQNGGYFSPTFQNQSKVLTNINSENPDLLNDLGIIVRESCLQQITGALAKGTPILKTPNAPTSIYYKRTRHRIEGAVNKKGNKIGLCISLKDNFWVTVQNTYKQDFGEITNYTIIHEPKLNKWYISIGQKFTTAPPIKKADKEAIGVDVGLTDTIVCSNGEHINTPKEAFNTNELKKKKLQRRLQKAKNAQDLPKIEKLGKALARAYNRQKNLGTDFSHKTSKKLSQHEEIYFEKLNIKKMVSTSSKGMRKSIMKSYWGEIKRLTKEKATLTKAHVAEVTANHTSQRCFECGHTHKDNRKRGSKFFICTSCGHTDDADLNASKNILARGQNGGEFPCVNKESVIE